MNTVNQMTEKVKEGKIPNQLTTPILRALDRKLKFKKTTHVERTQGEIRKGDFKRGEP